MRAFPPGKRLQKELLALQNDPPPGMTLNEKSVQNSITQWIVDMEGAPGTLYEGEKFQLLFKFSSRYPFDSPQVMFTGENIPVHPHVYSNGHICLSILTEDWSPALSVQSVCLSIISMLSSCKEKRRPPDNSFYVRTCNKNPKKTKWWYHVRAGKLFNKEPDSKYFQLVEGTILQTLLQLLNSVAEKAMAPHSSTLAWKIPWTEELGRLQS
ncbi:ubiquitin-conjugating enzyme E2 W isoform X1 [Bubalus kerabau]|uniref:ubiquitin-conjugating enzyme E2 W isoform X1 n=1 Tax=Bubalus carabanensis TaxID=3119969 RepID=UPI00244E8455|nr:ubiquitin-conjugating enzyme E2 W isoform X1 [Bubalus carabanensis]